MIRAALPANFRPLPIIATIRRAYQLLWLHGTLQLRLALPGFILLSAGIAVPTRTYWGMTSEQANRAIQSGAVIPHTLPCLLALVVGSVLSMSFGATWRRFLLLDKAPSVFTFDPPFRRYLTLLVIGNVVVSGGVLALAMAVGGLAGGWVILLAGMGLILLAFAKYPLLFTAALVEDHDLTWRQAGEAMRGNTLRYATIWLLLMLSIVFLGNVVTQLMAIVHVDGSSIAGAILCGMVNAAVLVLYFSLTSSAAALAYDYLVRGGGPVPEGQR